MLLDGRVRFGFGQVRSVSRFLKFEVRARILCVGLRHSSSILIWKLELLLPTTTHNGGIVQPAIQFMSTTINQDQDIGVYSFPRVVTADNSGIYPPTHPRKTSHPS
jgi:hypothetical protein